MALVSNQTVLRTAVPGGVETAILALEWSGITNMVFNASGFKVQNLTGASNFICRVYVNGAFLDSFEPNPKDENATAVYTFITKTFVDDDIVVVTVYHFESLTQDFRTTILGTGNV